MSTPCLNCGRNDYDRKVQLDIDGISVVACNLCSPEGISCTLEMRTPDEVVTSTGTFHAKLDWSQQNPVIGIESEMDRPPLWRRLRNFFRQSS